MTELLRYYLTEEYNSANWGLSYSLTVEYNSAN